MADSQFFIRLFASKRKQIAMMADKKPPTRIFLRLLTTSRSEMGVSMDLIKYEILLASIDLGSFTKASELLGYTPSGISHMMNHLENELGFPLLLRSKTRGKPTRECESLLPSLCEIIRQNNRLNQLTSEICGLTTETLTIVTYLNMANHLLSKIIKNFRSDYLGIYVSLIEDG